MERIKKLIDDKLAVKDAEQYCVFCFRSKSAIAKAQTVGNIDYLKDEYLIATGAKCSYAYHHDFGIEEVPKPKQVHKMSNDICVRCSCHRKNPLYATNGCQHEHGV